MHKLVLGLLLVLIIPISIQAYTIGGAYARLISCDWGQYGYEFGNIGTYDVNGEIYRIFFGSNYCEH